MGRMKKEEFKNGKNAILSILKNEDFMNQERVIATETIKSETGYTENQIKSMVHSMRLQSLKDERYLKYYPISKAKGYKLPEDDNDYLEMFLTMTRHAISRFITIKPVRKYLNEKGINTTEWVNKIKEEYKSKEHDVEDTSRFFVELSHDYI